MSNQARKVYIDNEPFIVTSYNRSVTDDMVARFGSPEKGQTNLDLLKAETQVSFRGGMFQREFNDPEKANYIRGWNFNPLDEFLYPIKKLKSTTYTGAQPNMSLNGVTAWCIFKNRLYIAYRDENPVSNPQNKIQWINLTTMVATDVTLPSAVANTAVPITDMKVHRNKIFICGQVRSSGTSTGFNCHRYDGVTSFQDIGGIVNKCVSFRDSLYGIATNSMMYIASNEFAAGSATWNTVKRAGYDNDDDLNIQDFLIFNNAVYVTKTTGLWRYDGVDVTPVIDLSNHDSFENFKYSTVFNGRFYYTIQNKLYEFDGFSIRLIQDFSDAYQIKGLTADDKNLYIVVIYNVTSESIFDKGEFSGTALTNYTYAYIIFDGVGFFEQQSLEYMGSDSNGFIYQLGTTIVSALGKLLWIFPWNYLNGSLESRSDGYRIYETDTTYDTTPRYVYGSEMDMGYPSLPKTLNGVKLDYDGILEDIFKLTVEVSYYKEGSWGLFNPIWNTQTIAVNGSSNDYSLHEYFDDGVENLSAPPEEFERMRYRIKFEYLSGTQLSVPRLKSITLRYTLQPRMRKRWLLTLSLHDSLNTLDESVGSSTASSASKLRKILYDVYASKLPVLFFDVDYTKLTQIDTAGPDYDFLVSGLYQFQHLDCVAIQNDDGTWHNRKIWMMIYDSPPGQTGFRLANTGHRYPIGGTNYLSTSVGKEVRKSHAVYITRINNEKYLLDDDVINDNDGLSDIASEITIEVVEV